MAAPGDDEQGRLPDSAPMRRVLIVGGGLAGLAAARELRGRFRVTLVDPKEYFEFTPGIMRAYVRPRHWDSITFLYEEVLERSFGVGFIWGEVTRIDGEAKCAHVKPMFSNEEDVVCFDYCVVASGCSFNSDTANGESPWFPTVQQRQFADSEFPHLDERHLEGRRRRILEEHQLLRDLNNREGSVLIVGAGSRGVQFACELEENFPSLRIVVSDFLPRCCHSMPEDAIKYCEAYMRSRNIRLALNVQYKPKNPEYWTKIGLPRGVDKTYVTTNFKQYNTFMPASALTAKGPGGDIATNIHLQVVEAAKTEKLLGDECIFAVGDCIRGKIGEGPDCDLPQVPKTGYTVEQQAVTACQNLICKDRKLHGGGSVWLCCVPFPSMFARKTLKRTWHPWGSGIFSISLGSEDGCLVVGGYSQKDSSRMAISGQMNEKDTGRMLLSGQTAAAAKELIESTKLAQCRGDHWISSWIWYLIHHCPFNCTKSKAPMLDLSLISRQ